MGYICSSLSVPYSGSSKTFPNFTELVAQLHDFMERFYGHTDKLTKCAVSGVFLALHGLGKTELDVLKARNKALANGITLAHRDPSQHLCVYTDASDLARDGIITQVPLLDVTRPQKEQRPSPLSFLSGRFVKTQLGWSVLEKECYEAMKTVDRMQWLFAAPAGFYLYTDHKNLIFLFEPLAVVDEMSQSSLRKLLRWAIELSV